MEANRLVEQGIQQYQANQLNAAIASWQQGLALYRKVHSQQGEGIVLLRLAKAYYALGEDKQAIAYFQQGLRIAQNLKDLANQRTALAGLGEVYYFQGDYGKAITLQQQGLAIARKLNIDEMRGWRFGILELPTMHRETMQRPLDIIAKV